MKTLLQLAAIAIVFLTGCNLINPQEKLPAYIYIEEIDFDGEISNNHKITELWVYNDQNLIGVFDVPAKIPVLSTGTSDFKIFAGIKENGISSNRLAYPFYKPYEVTLVLRELETTIVVPHFEYKDNVVFPPALVEQFETGFLNYQPFGTSDTSFVITSQEDEIFSEDGSAFSGKVVFEADFNLWQVESDQVQLSAGSEVWAEFNYKSNNSFSVGLRPYVNGIPESLASALIIKNTTDDNGIAQWNKIYVHLSSAVGGNANASGYSLYIQAAKDPEVPAPLLFFDNIKLVHFE